MPRDALCRSVIEASIYVAGWIDRQPQVKEESITDWALDWLAQKTNRFAYKLFTRHEEARVTGADFEWWILGDNRAFKARVQAKRLKADVDNYPGLAHTNEHGLQIVKLIENANAEAAAPLYLFYANSLVLEAPRVGNGMFVAAAKQIDDSFVRPEREYVNDHDVLDRSIPLSVIFCLAGWAKPSPGALETMVRFIRSERGPGRGDSSFAELDSEQGIHRHVPAQVRSFAEAGISQRREFSEGWFRDSFRGVDALFVIDLRHMP